MFESYKFFSYNEIFKHYIILSTLVDRFLLIFNLYNFYLRWLTFMKEFFSFIAARNEFYVIYLFNKQTKEQLTMSEYVQGVWLLIYFFIALCIELDSLNCRYIPSKSLCCCCGVVFFNPLTPICDQDRISPYNINTISSRQVMGIKRNINLGIKLI